ncbi:hypothetical protein EC396_02940 [Lutibacter sp. HS1-25]|uniref:hypothetical protein n=1 Tax=Lutibacter sp. HS1-25 TaxID=2485000 RepID=UPI001011502A|nr:hypothetical protein [Lutibacter sp. HS1-25]RXP62690.1 hypothetical protein EC396_02940 [Lutibacter sp. HS1-25]
MKVSSRILSIVCFLFLVVSCAENSDGEEFGTDIINDDEPIEEIVQKIGLEDFYSGEIKWDKATGTVTFMTSGKIFFPSEGLIGFIWNVPTKVKQIIIKENVTVDGAFHTFSDCTISGENRKTSILYGLEEQAWANNNNLTAYKISSIECHNGTLTVSNLTSLNPRSFHVRGNAGAIHLKDADFIDNRGGHHNHSDGIAAGDGSTVDNCYFETGDDVIKVYSDITVTNTTIKMVQNAVPIQLGWGNYSDGAVGTFKNLKIIGDSGRGNPDQSNPIICGRTGKYAVTLNIDGLIIDNPTASMVNLFDDNNDGVYEKTVKGTLKNVQISNIRRYSNQLKGNDELKIFDTEGKEISKDF